MKRAQSLDTTCLMAVAGPISLGILIACLVSVLLSELPLRWLIVLAGGVVVLLPTLAVKNVKLYCLGLFLFVLMLEGQTGKNLTNDLMDGNQLIDSLGIPPVKTVGIIVRPSDVVLLGFLVYWLYQIISKRERFEFPRPAFFPLAFMIWATGSALLKAPYFFLSLMELVQLAKYFLVFLLITHAVDSKDIAKGVIQILILCLIVETTVALAGWKFSFARDLLAILNSPSVSTLVELPEAYEGGISVGRVVGTFRDYAITAVFLHFLFPFVLVRVFHHALWKRLAYLLLLALWSAVLYLTYSRTGLIAALVGSICCVCLAYLRGVVSRRQLLSLSYAGILIAVVLSPFLMDYMQSRPSNFAHRIPIMEESLVLLADHLVLGVGLNNSTAVRKGAFVRSLEEEVQRQGSQPIHNHYLVIALETGLVGFVLFLAFFVLIVREALRQIHARDVELALFAIAIVSSFAAVAVQLLVDTMGSHVIYTLLYFYSGLVVAFARLNQGTSMSRNSFHGSPLTSAFV